MYTCIERNAGSQGRCTVCDNAKGLKPEKKPLYAALVNVKFGCLLIVVEFVEDGPAKIECDIVVESTHKSSSMILSTSIAEKRKTARR